MGTGYKQVFLTQYCLDGFSKGSFIPPDNFINPGTGVLNVWFFLAGKGFWKGIQIHYVLYVKNTAYMTVNKGCGINLKFSGIYRPTQKESR